VQSGSVVTENTFDGLGRRIIHQVKNCADLDSTYHQYYDGQRMIETRNGSDQVLQQLLWGGQYIDELIQIGWNQDPIHASGGTSPENTCERFFWTARDANYNVLGLVSAKGVLTERYEYDPYGNRRVFSRGYIMSDATDDGLVNSDDYGVLDRGEISRGDLNGDGIINADDYGIIDREFTGNNSLPSNDPLAMGLRLGSFRGNVNGTTATSALGLCPVGHQGLWQDEENGLIYNRARFLHPVLGRFCQRDPIGYADSVSLYEYVKSRVIHRRDPGGHSCDDECSDIRCPAELFSFTVPLDILDDLNSVLKDMAWDKILEELPKVVNVAAPLLSAVTGADLFEKYFSSMLDLTGFDIYTYVVYAKCGDECCGTAYRRALKGPPSVSKIKCSAAGKPASNGQGQYWFFNGANNWEHLVSSMYQCNVEGKEQFRRNVRSQFPNCPALNKRR